MLHLSLYPTYQQGDSFVKKCIAKISRSNVFLFLLRQIFLRFRLTSQHHFLFFFSWLLFQASPILNCKHFELKYLRSHCRHDRNETKYLFFMLLLRNFSSDLRNNFFFSFHWLKPATHLAILYADRGEFDRQRKSRAIFATD